MLDTSKNIYRIPGVHTANPNNRHCLRNCFYYYYKRIELFYMNSHIELDKHPAVMKQPPTKNVF